MYFKFYCIVHALDVKNKQKKAKHALHNKTDMKAYRQIRKKAYTSSCRLRSFRCIISLIVQHQLVNCVMQMSNTPKYP